MDAVSAGWRFRRLVVMSAVVGLVASSCSGDGGATTTTESTTTTTEATTTTPSTTTTTTLPGDPIDLFPQEGDILAVVGVNFDSVLNLRVAPGTDQDVLEKLDPLTDNLVATGRARQIPDSIWYEVTYQDTTGWVSSSYVAWLGSTDDITAEVIEDLGTTPEAETMTDLGLDVAVARASEDPPSRVRLTVAPSVGDLGEVTYDVVGLGDDAVFGERLHVFGQPSESGEGFVLATVERTLMCARGLTPEQTCP